MTRYLIVLQFPWTSQEDKLANQTKTVKVSLSSQINRKLKPCPCPPHPPHVTPAMLQGDKEREAGLDVSPMCDRNNATTEKSQV